METVSIRETNLFLFLLLWSKFKPGFGDKADGIDLLMALPPPSSIGVERGIVHLKQTWGQKACNFGWATFEWASCIIDTFVKQWTPWSSLSYNLASMAGLMFGSMSSEAHRFTLHRVDDQCRLAGLEPRLVSELRLPYPPL